mgnify:CR=1 FL=1|jgi:hypothetical protein
MQQMHAKPAIHPFRIRVAEEELRDLRERLVRADISGRRVRCSLNRDESRKALDYFRGRLEL